MSPTGTSETEALARILGSSPEMFPHTLDVPSDRVGFIRLQATDYRSASFLDERLLTPTTFRRALPWPDVDRAATHAGLGEQLGYIFHVGHAGSTLVSRLLGAQAGIFALREPAALRTFALKHVDRTLIPQAWGPDGFERRLGSFLKLWSRTFGSGEQVVLKATSFASELGVALLSRPSQPRALLMFVAAESYLATILGGANAPAEARALGPLRKRRLEHRLGQPIDPLDRLSLGETVAMSWACEMTALLAANRAAADRTHLMDFDAFLSEPLPMLGQAFRHFHVPATDEDLVALLGSPDMRRYSKAPEHAYDRGLRAQVLNQARVNSGSEIRRGLAWLETLARRDESVKEALETRA